VPDNSTAINIKKSARQIYAEAFMEDEQAYGMSGKRVYDETDYTVDPKADENAEAEAEVDLDTQETDLDEIEEKEPADLLESLMGDDEEEEEPVKADL
jgi:hypothetical protein